MLFEASKIGDDHGKAITHQVIDVSTDARRLKDFKKLLGEIIPGSNIHFQTGGNWSLHELIGFLFSVVGSAELYFSTWAIREESVRALLQLKETGLARSISCMIDHRAAQRDNQTILFAQSNFDRVKFAPCHAKVTVIRNETWGVVINGSQNYTKNPRIESGVITCDKTIADFHIKWILND